jgi:hypothetical protein
MTSNEDISLSGLPPSDFRDQVLHNTEQDAFYLDQVNLRQQESNTKRAFVLAGSAILQLPIWGMLNPNVDCNSTYKRRLRDELWSFPRILFR